MAFLTTLLIHSLWLPLAVPIHSDVESKLAPATQENLVISQSVNSGPFFRTRRERGLPHKVQFVQSADLDGDGYEDLVAAAVDSNTPGEAPDSSLLLVWRGSADGLESTPSQHAIGSYPLKPVVMKLGEANANAAPRSVLAIASRSRQDLSVLAWNTDPDGRLQAQELWKLDLPSVPRAVASGFLSANTQAKQESPSLVVVGDHDLCWVVNAGVITHKLRLERGFPRCVHVSSAGNRFVVGFQVSRGLSSYAWTGDQFELESNLQLNGIPRAFCEIDWNLDGDRELVVATGSDQVAFLGTDSSNGHSGWMNSAPSYESSESIPIDLDTADLNQDGKQELLVLSASGLSLEVWQPAGASKNKSTSKRKLYAGQSTTSMTQLDSNGDGLSEIAIANQDAVALSFFSNNGQQLDAQRLTPTGEFPTELAAGDFNGDGFVDVITLDSEANQVSMLLNTSSSGTTRQLQRHGHTRVGPAPRSPQCLDLDGDGHLDLALLIVDLQGARMVRLFGDGQGHLARRASIPDLPISPNAVGLLPVDLDRDGQREWIVFDDERDSLFLLAGSGAALQTILQAKLPSGPYQAQTIELDGDPTPELVVALSGHPRPGLVMGNFSRALDSSWQWNELAHQALDPPRAAPKFVEVRDLDFDGTPELISLAPQGTEGHPAFLNVTQLRPSAGGWQLNPQPAQLTSLAGRHLLVEDLDQNGSYEILATCQFSHIVDLFLTNLNDPTPQRVDRIGAGIGPMATIACDLNNDGQAELIVANGNEDNLSIIELSNAP